MSSPPRCLAPVFASALAALAAFAPPAHPAGLGWWVPFLSPDGNVVVLHNPVTGAVGGWEWRRGGTGSGRTGGRTRSPAGRRAPRSPS